MRRISKEVKYRMHDALAVRYQLSCDDYYYYFIQHPHLLIIEDIDFEEDYLSVLMENVAVGSLRDIIYQVSLYFILYRSII